GFVGQRSVLQAFQHARAIGNGAPPAVRAAIAIEQLNREDRHGSVFRVQGHNAFGVFRGAGKIAQLQARFNDGAIDLRALAGFRIFLQEGVQIADHRGAVVAGVSDGFLEFRVFGGSVLRRALPCGCLGGRRGGSRGRRFLGQRGERKNQCERKRQKTRAGWAKQEHSSIVPGRRRSGRKSCMRRAGWGMAQVPLCTLMPPETVCTSTRPVESPTWARKLCLLCSSIITGRLVRISPEVASAENRKEELAGTRMSTEPETVFRSQKRLPLGFPRTSIGPEMTWARTSLLAPVTFIEPLTFEASTRLPGFSMWMEPEIAVAWMSPLTPVMFTLPEAVETRRTAPIPETSMEPLAALSCVSRSTP